MADKGIQAEILDLAELPNDLVGKVLYQSDKAENSGFEPFQELVSKTDKFIFIIPEYNGSYPGILKTFVDCLQFPHSFRGKKGGMVGISSGTQGAALSMGHFSDVLNYLGMHLLALRPRFIHIEKNIQGNEISNPEYISFLRRHVDEMISF